MKGKKIEILRNSFRTVPIRMTWMAVLAGWMPRLGGGGKKNDEITKRCEFYII
jgi:hypothetical protein